MTSAPLPSNRLPLWHAATTLLLAEVFALVARTSSSPVGGAAQITNACRNQFDAVPTSSSSACTVTDVSEASGRIWLSSTLPLPGVVSPPGPITRVPAGHVAVRLLGADVLAVNGVTRASPVTTASAWPTGPASTRIAATPTSEIECHVRARTALMQPSSLRVVNGTPHPLAAPGGSQDSISDLIRPPSPR